MTSIPWTLGLFTSYFSSAARHNYPWFMMSVRRSIGFFGPSAQNLIYSRIWKWSPKMWQNIDFRITKRRKVVNCPAQRIFIIHKQPNNNYLREENIIRCVSDESARRDFVDYHSYPSIDWLVFLFCSSSFWLCGPLPDLLLKLQRKFLVFNFAFFSVVNPLDLLETQSNAAHTQLTIYINQNNSSDPPRGNQEPRRRGWRQTHQYIQWTLLGIDVRTSSERRRTAGMSGLSRL